MAIDPQLEKVVTYMVSAEGQIANGTFGTGQRPWMNFKPVQTVAKFNFAGLKQLFSRQEANDQYVNKRASKTATAGDLQAAKISADYLAGCARDYAMRTRSRVRTIVHSGNRAAANGLPIGPLNRNSVGWLTRIISEQASNGQ